MCVCVVPWTVFVLLMYSTSTAKPKLYCAVPISVHRQTDSEMDMTCFVFVSCRVVGVSCLAQLFVLIGYFQRMNVLSAGWHAPCTATITRRLKRELTAFLDTTASSNTATSHG